MSREQQTPPVFPEARAKNSSQRKTVWLIALFGTMAILVAGGIIGGLAGYYDGRSDISFGEGAGPLLSGSTSFVATAASMLWSLEYWKSIDEMARRAHLDSWFWGGVLGSIPVLVFGAIAASFPQFKFAPIEQLAASPTQAFGFGAIALYTLMLLGYIIFWLFWWAKKR